MKKILFSLVALITLLITMPVVNASEKVKVYMFTKEGCSACESAYTYFETLAEEEPDLFELIDLEVWDSNNNSNGDDYVNLLVYVYDYFGGDTDKAGTPTIVIGEYFSVGFPVDTDEIYEAIIAERDAEEQTDVVEELAAKLSIDIDELVTGTTGSTDSKTEIIVVVCIIAVVAVGAVGVIFVSQKS